MKAYKASLVNSLTLIVCGIWGFYSVAEPVSLTPFIPAIIGIFLLGMNDGIKNENKLIAHLAVLLTLLSFANIMPLMGQLNPAENIEKDWILEIILFLDARQIKESQASIKAELERIKSKK